MALRLAYAPVLPEMDPFLFASVDEDLAGIPLSVLSLLSRLDLDPRNEAVRLSQLTKDVASDQLTQMIARLPDRHWTSLETRRIAARLVALLPTTNKDTEGSQTAGNAGQTISTRASPSLIYLALAGAVLIGLVAHGVLSPAGQGAAQTTSQTDPALPSAQQR